MKTRRKRFAFIPWVFALAYGIPAPFIAMQSSEGWGYLILAMLTFPVGYLFLGAITALHDFIFGDPVVMDVPLAVEQRRVLIYQVGRFLIFVGGGILWYFLLGVGLRRILQRVFPGRADIQGGSEKAQSSNEPNGAASRRLS